jgi:hypothetical protein
MYAEAKADFFAGFEKGGGRKNNKTFLGQFFEAEEKPYKFAWDNISLQIFALLMCVRTFGGGLVLHLLL